MTQPFTIETTGQTTMTREEIEQSYTVINGVIQSPGKFEGEPAYVVDFWNAVMDGCGEDIGDDDNAVQFDIEPSDLATWPELSGATQIILWEDGSGFVRHELVQP